MSRTVYRLRCDLQPHILNFLMDKPATRKEVLEFVQTKVVGVLQSEITRAVKDLEHSGGAVVQGDGFSSGQTPKAPVVEVEWQG